MCDLDWLPAAVNFAVELPQLLLGVGPLAGPLPGLHRFFQGHVILFSSHCVGDSLGL